MVAVDICDVVDTVKVPVPTAAFVRFLAGDDEGASAGIEAGIEATRVHRIDQGAKGGRPECFVRGGVGRLRAIERDTTVCRRLGRNPGDDDVHCLDGVVAAGRVRLIAIFRAAVIERGDRTAGLAIRQHDGAVLDRKDRSGNGAAAAGIVRNAAGQGVQLIQHVALRTGSAGGAIAQHHDGLGLVGRERDVGIRGRRSAAARRQDCASNEKLLAGADGIIPQRERRRAGRRLRRRRRQRRRYWSRRHR